MKKNVIKTMFCATLIIVPTILAEDKAVTTVTKKDPAASTKVSAPKETSPKTQTLSATDLLSHKDVKVDATIRVVESFTSMGESEKGQVKRSEIEAKRDLSMQEVQDESKKFEKAKADYLAKSTTMSDSAREKEEKKLIKMERDIKNLVAEKEEELKLDMQSATESLAQDLEQSIVRLAQNENIDIVIDKMTGRALYVSPEFDITQKAIEEMNKTYKVELAQNAKQAKQAEQAVTKVAENKTVAAPKTARASA